ncbi:MAG: HDOD domain-containing protein [Syntrophobacteraceae bacterium]|nr:HDOD domain-containing protein [Syntrophobacteraceae bacterium]
MVRELSGHEIDALHYELLVKDIIAAAERLPPFPDIAWKIVSLVKSMAPVRQIEELIALDPTIAAKVLRMGNSAYYGRQYGVRTVREAILLLGDKRLLQVVVAACATLYYGPGNSADERELWEHSVNTALLSEIIARRIQHGAILSLYTASLLHDIGKTVLNLYARIYLHSSLHEIRGESDRVQAERRTLGIDHQELGGIISRNWKFPPDIVSAIEHHHKPEKATKYEEISSIVYIADTLALYFCKQNDRAHDKTIDPESDPVFKQFGITLKMVEDFRNELKVGMADVAKALGSV